MFEIEKTSIMKWFENCEYLITISQSNKSDSVNGVLTNNNDTYRVSGKTYYSVLSDLKSMVEGTYRKSDNELGNL